MARVKMILVGGFLGAGKTTLLARTAEQLARRGLSAALMTNDQAANLVDTAVLRQAGREVREVSGACFCCAFNKMLHLCDQLIEQFRPDAIVGEPVGSCTDLSATVLQPLKKYCGDRFDVAPFTVMLDPRRARRNVLTPAGGEGSAPEPLRYIYRKQIEEADLIVLNKVDTLAADQRDEIVAGLERMFPSVPVLTMSASTGLGVEPWLDAVLKGRPGGLRIAEVDYDIYAAGEAALGWLNASGEVQLPPGADWPDLARRILLEIRAGAEALGAEVAHVKVSLSAGGSLLQANLTDNASEPALRGEIAPGRSDARIILNARVRAEPPALRSLVEQGLRRAAGPDFVQIDEITCFQPARPQPVHRMNKVVDGKTEG